MSLLPSSSWPTFCDFNQFVILTISENPLLPVYFWIQYLHFYPISNSLYGLIPLKLSSHIYLSVTFAIVPAIYHLSLTSFSSQILPSLWDLWNKQPVTLLFKFLKHYKKLCHQLLCDLSKKHIQHKKISLLHHFQFSEENICPERQ